MTSPGLLLFDKRDSRLYLVPSGILDVAKRANDLPFDRLVLPGTRVVGERSQPEEELLQTSFFQLDLYGFSFSYSWPIRCAHHTAGGLTSDDASLAKVFACLPGRLARSKVPLRFHILMHLGAFLLLRGFSVRPFSQHLGSMLVSRCIV